MALNRACAIPILAFVIACDTGSTVGEEPTDLAAARAEVLAASDSYMQAVSALDAELVASMWTEDGIAYPPDAEALVGREALQQMLAASYPQMTIEDFAVHSREIEPSGGTAYEVTTYSERIQVGSAEPQDLNGRYMFVWRKMPDGSWRISRGIYNYSSGAFRHPTTADSVGGAER